MWYLAREMWYVTRDMWHLVVAEVFLNVLAPQLLWFGIDSVLKILNKKMTQSMNHFIAMSDEGVSRAAPAEPGLVC